MTDNTFSATAFAVKKGREDKKAGSAVAEKGEYLLLNQNDWELLLDNTILFLILQLSFRMKL
jgi:hypothetical protein